MNRHFIRVQQNVFGRLLAAFLFLAAALDLSAQGTAISYQGRLSDSGAPANTNYDFRFTVFNAPTNGSAVSVAVTNLAVPVSNGVFSVIVDFGPGVFNGTSNGSNDWLDVGVRATGGASFTTLNPRQPILPVPYALFATSASNLFGTVPSSLVTGAYTNVVSFSNVTNTFTGTFTGNGVGLTNLNASQIASGTLADARLSTNVALLNGTQTFTGVNTFTNSTIFTGGNSFAGTNTFSGPINFKGTNFFSGVNTFTNNGNYFQGSFFGNGLVGWLPVYGTGTNAMRDAGYLMLGSGLSTVTLPTSASLLVGDIVRVSGGGGGGWLVAENSGQSINGTFARYTNSTLMTLSSPAVNSSGHNDYGVAASGDGVRMYVVGDSTFGVYVSTDSGQTWGQAGIISGSYNSVACSENGQIVYAQPTSGTIQKSVNGGLTWSSSGMPTATGQAIACTADGNTLIIGNAACSGNGVYRARIFSNQVQVSTNSGTSYTSVAVTPGGVFCLGASSDCTRLVAGVSNGLLYASSNMGATWTSLTTSNQIWSGAWMSPDGSKFAATVSWSGGAVGGLYSCNVSALPNTISTNSTICGSQGSAVELQYIGNNQFIPVSSSGLIWAN